MQKSALKCRNPLEIQKSTFEIQKSILKSEIHVKSSGFRNLIRRGTPWRTPRSSPGGVLDSTCTTAEVTQLIYQNQASEMRGNIPKCFPINQLPAITSAKKIQPSLVLWARLAWASCMRASPARLD